MYTVNLHDATRQIPRQYAYINGLIISMLVDGVGLCQLSACGSQLLSWFLMENEIDKSLQWFAVCPASIDKCEGIRQFFERFGDRFEEWEEENGPKANIILGRLEYLVGEIKTAINYTITKPGIPFMLTFHISYHAKVPNNEGVMGTIDDLLSCY